MGDSSVMKEAARIIADEIAAAREFLGEDASGAAPLLPLLHALQGAFGNVDPDLVPEIAGALNISTAEVRGTISFYHDFRSAPAGHRTLRLCRAEACQARGGELVAAYLADKHGLKPGGTTPDGSLTLESVYCLGNCALGPAALVDDELVGRVDEARVDALVSGGRV
ncbi:MAG: NAD(P)H-dependent oxidoreductase subunit E [Hyphomicrobiales bacterium]|nr:NAD(P)H-dependent oxidoreductase subunit E [Hyphomicrobiales bacterium]